MNTEKKLAGRVAVVTGAAQGLGRECARVLAMHGAKIAILDINGEAAEKAAASLVEEGGDAIAVSVDVASEEQVKTAVGRVIDHYGRIDILHNNAAIQNVAQREGDLDVCNLDLACWDRAFAVNVRGAVAMCKHTIPHMLAQGGGSIIHSSSGFGAQGELSLTAYGASKAALTQLSRSIATQYGKRRVRSNVVQIGLAPAENALSTMNSELLQIVLDGHLTPELGTPRNIADAVAFLASDEAAFITGHALVVDGGFSAHMPTTAAMKKLFDKSGSSRI